MQLNISSSSWWGPPKKFDRPKEDRRVSWLELFYDLVYVIAISRITNHLSMDISLVGFLEYILLFILIFWGWLNGSLHHDLHGNEGLRTRLMTLWQMMIIAALAVVIDQLQGKSYFYIIVVFMIMQLFITYMWWSVGFYDRSHRKYNKPYTVLYLIALALMGLSLFVPLKWQKLIFPVILLCNYAPPFVSQRLLRHDSSDLNLSSSMFERLGLFAIIVFGEVALGVVNGISKTQISEFSNWLNFALAISTVFALWWIFFTLVAQREAKNGFVNATLLELLYIPSLISLGLIAASFTNFFDIQNEMPLQKLGYAITTFLICICLIMELLVFPGKILSLKVPVQVSLLITAILFFVSTFVNIDFNRTYYLASVTLILLVEIIYLNSMYYKMIAKEKSESAT